MTSRMERLEQIVARLPEARRVDIEAWGGEPTFRVGGKNFVFASPDATSISLKLPAVEAAALVATEPRAVPTGYGLGRHGWVTISLTGRLGPGRWREDRRARPHVLHHDRPPTTGPAGDRRGCTAVGWALITTRCGRPRGAGPVPGAGRGPGGGRWRSRRGRSRGAPGYHPRWNSAGKTGPPHSRNRSGRWPSVERPRLFERGGGLPARCARPRRPPGRKSWAKRPRGSNGSGKDVTGVRPPLAGGLPRARGTMAATRRAGPLGYVTTRGAVNPASDWATKITLAAVPDGIDHDLGVLGQAGAVVVTGQVGGHDVVAERPEPWGDEVPVPGVRPGAVDEGVAGHHPVDGAGDLDSSAGGRLPGPGGGRTSPPSVPRSSERPAPSRDHWGMGRPPGHSDTGGHSGSPAADRVMEHR